MNENNQIEAFGHKPQRLRKRRKKGELGEMPICPSCKKYRMKLTPVDSKLDLPPCADHLRVVALLNCICGYEEEVKKADIKSRLPIW
jgi:hypothetical protein